MQDKKYIINNLELQINLFKTLGYCFDTEKITADYLYNILKKKCKNQLVYLGKEFCLNKINKKNRFLSLSENKKIIIQLILYPNKPLKNIKNLYQILLNNEKFVLSKIIKNLSVKEVYTFNIIFQNLLRLPYKFLIFLINFFKVYNKNIISNFIIIQYLLFNKYYVNKTPSLYICKFFTFNNKKFRITINNNYTKMFIIKPRKIGKDCYDFVFEISQSQFTSMDFFFFNIYLQKFIKHNKNVKFSLKLIFYIKIRNNNNKQLFYSHLQNNKNFNINHFLKGFAKRFNNFNAEDYYNNVEKMSFVLWLTKTNVDALKIIPFKTIKFINPKIVHLYNISKKI